MVQEKFSIRNKTEISKTKLFNLEACKPVVEGIHGKLRK